MATGQGFLVLVGAPPCIGEKLPPWDGDRDQSLSGDGDRDRGQFSPHPRPRFLASGDIPVLIPTFS